MAEITAWKRQTGEVRPWFARQAIRHNAALTQAWLTPLGKPVLILSDYQEAQDIFLRRGKEFHRGPRNCDAFHGSIPEHHIAMMSSDPRFKRNKELVRDLMTPGFLHEVSAPGIYAKSLILVELWALKSQLAQGKPFNALADIFNAATDMINAAAFAFGSDMSAIKAQLDHIRSCSSPETIQASSFPVDASGAVQFPTVPELPDISACRDVAEHVGVLFNALMPRLEDRWKMLTNRRLKKSVKRKDEMIRREIEKSLARMESGDGAMLSAVDHLLQREKAAATKADRNPDFHSRKIYDELLGYIVAGHETSATALAWTIKLIASHQHVQERLRMALRTAYASAAAEERVPMVSEITTASAPYLDAVIEESLRYAPPIPLLIRSAKVDTTLLGHHVPMGTTVFMPAVGPSYTAPAVPVRECDRSESSRTKGWGGRWDEEDMHLFQPDRWLKVDENGKERFHSQAGPMITFGLGLRSCFGKRLAYLEVRIMLALLVWNFRFKEIEGRLASNEANEAITTSPKFCYVALETLC
ncbi:hypothetical protein DL768_000800 [Monosporascus sp. mg162]|nr:hypothetical protein DL768_000800 [Monosporascus sp. mg162]